MFYVAKITHDSKYWDADFPDCPGCHTFADSREELRAAAQEALEGWLEAHLIDGEAPPRPRTDWKPGRRNVMAIHVPPALASALSIRWARQDLGLSQAQLAKRMRVTQQAVARLEQPDANPELATIEKAAKALGLNVELSFSAA